MFKKTIKKYFYYSFILVYFFTVPFTAGAQEASNPKDPKGLVTCSGPDCTINDFFRLLEEVIQFIIMIGIVSSSLIFAYAGFLYITAQGDTGKVQKATKIFTNVGVGLFLALIAFLVIEVIIVALGLDFDVLPIKIGR